MAETVADALVRRLCDWDVDRIFGYPGETINPILESLRQLGKPDFIQARHEETAALMASGHARYTGKPGVVLTTTGPGAIHQLNGLYDATLDHQPVVALMGYPARMAVGGSYQQEIDLMSVFKDVAGEYLQMVTVADQMPQLLDRALRVALSQRRVTALILPYDVQKLPMPERPSREHYTWYTARGFTRPVVVPDDDSLDAAAEKLNSCSKIAILVGQGARGAADQVIAAAETLGAGVAKALLGKDVLSDQLPYVTGSIGLLGTTATAHMMAECDGLLVVGSSFPYAEWMPEPGQAKGVQIDIDARMIGIRYPMDVHLVGDARITLAKLLPRLRRRQNGWRSQVEAWVNEWRADARRRADAPADPLNPQFVVREISSRLPGNAVVCDDSGSCTYWYARQLEMRADMRGLQTGLLATMGASVPYAIAAKLATPDRPVYVLVGDGAMQMLGINELITISQRWKEWTDPRLVIVVLHNNDLNEVTWLMRNHEGHPAFKASQDLPDFPYAAYARMLGLGGVKVDSRDEVQPAIDQAMSAKTPFLLEAMTDRLTPLLPPEIRPKTRQALEAMLSAGDPEIEALGRKAAEERLAAEGFRRD